MKNIYKTATLFFTSVLISACAGNMAGSGELTISSNIDQAFKTYLQLPKPLAFAVSADGNNSGWMYCESRFNCKVRNAAAKAIASCNDYDGGKNSCKIYAVGSDVVWDGTVNVASNEKNIQTDIGSGPLNVSLEVDKQYYIYTQQPEPMAFAISTDGVKSGGALCNNPGNCQGLDGKAFAVSQCNENNSSQAPCKVFAIGRKIVWQGERKLAINELAEPVEPVEPPAPLAAEPQPVTATKPTEAQVEMDGANDEISNEITENVAEPEDMNVLKIKLKSSKAFKDLEEEIKNIQKKQP